MEKQKVIIVGASHGGHQSALELLDKYDNVDVTIYEAGDFVSFMSCGMQLYLEDKATAKDDVRNFAPADLEAKGGRIFNNHQVTKINADKKTVIVKDVLTDQEEEVSYDKLILSSGVTPQTLPVPGNDLENIYLMRGYDWAGKIKSALNNPAIKNVAVIGAGNIGIEAVEVFANAGRNVTLLDMIDKPMGNYVNDELADLVAAELEKHHVTQVLGAKIEAFEGDGKVTAIKTDKGQVDTDLVIVAAGVKPNTKWLEGTVDLTDRGFIQTDAYLRTNLPDVYAIGDAILPWSIPGQAYMPVALATTARREAMYLASHLFESKPSRPFKGVVGSSAFGVFDLHGASAGLNTFSAGRIGKKIATSLYEDSKRPAYVPEKDNAKVYVSLTFDPDSHQILGGAVLSSDDITAQTNVLSLAIEHKLSLEDLAEADFFFQPGYDRQWSLLNLAAQHALGWARF